MRFMGVDVGTRRVGIAVSDDDGMLAVPSRAVTADEAVSYILNLAPENVIIGLPLDLSGKEGLAARRTRAFASRLEDAALKADVIFKIHWFDERFSTTVASNLLSAAGISQKNQKDKVDALAATQILQGFLDLQKYNGQESE